MGESEKGRAGRRALQEARAVLVQKAMEQLQQREPDLAAELAANPGRAARMRLVERLLERSVERKPSLLGQVGLSAIQALAAAADEADGGGEGDGGADAGSSARLTVVFTDLEGFTEWTEREGDEAASVLLAAHHRTVEPIIRARGGRLVKRLGDGLLITFPEAPAAVLGCLELVDHQPHPLRLRAGVHVGRVLITADDVIGHVVNLTARVAEIATGAQVLATGDVCDAVGGDLPHVRFGPTRPERFKGIEGPVPVCAVEWG